MSHLILKHRANLATDMPGISQGCMPLLSSQLRQFYIKSNRRNLLVFSLPSLGTHSQSTSTFVLRKLIVLFLILVLLTPSVTPVKINICDRRNTYPISFFYERVFFFRKLAKVTIVQYLKCFFSLQKYLQYLIARLNFGRNKLLNVYMYMCQHFY